MANVTTYNNNSNLKRCGVEIEYTEEQIIELKKCAEDPIYFVDTYCKIVTLDKGIQPFKLWDFQKDLINTYHNNRMVLTMLSRQASKTSTTVGYILWYTVFQANKNVAVVANKDETAREVLSRYQFMYEYLPIWLQQGIKVWNKGDVELENGSKVFTSATSSSGLRGKSCVAGDTKVCIEDNENVYYTEIENILNNSNFINNEDTIVNKQYAIYKITNLKNNKIYVGFHSIGEFSIRSDYIGTGSIFKDGYMGSGKLIKAAVEKYGPENFSQEILKIFDNKKEAEDYEKSIVNKEFTLDQMTYNLSIGGNVCILYGENCGFYGRKHTPESLQKIQETRNKNGLPTYQSKILCIKTGIEYKGDKEICKHFDFENSPEFNFSETPSKCIRMFIYRLCYEGVIRILDDKRNQLAIDRYTRYLNWLDSAEERKAEFAQKISERFTNRKQSEEQIEKRILGNKLWRENNPELHYEKMMKLNTNPEKIAKTAAKHRGMKRSAEACKNISASKQGCESSVKGKRLATHKETGIIKYFDPTDVIPEEYTTEFSGYNVGKKSYTDGTEYKMFVEGTEPEGWWRQGPPKKKKS